MAYVALYRKWRPGSFSTLVGQEHVSHTLANAIVQGKLAHAYLFTGPRGTGKTSTAKILAKAMNCEKGPTPEPCNECDNCRQINDGTSMDVYEIDAASNRGIDEIRELRETVKFAPVNGRFKIYIIDEVHMLTTEAFNALLKTLEEPPANVIFVLATTEIHKVPATIQSRCQRYDFKRIGIEDIEARLGEVCEKSGINADAAGLRLIACQADGGMRDALSILDQCAALSDSKITAETVRDVLGLIGHEEIVRITRAIATHNAPEVLAAISDALSRGRDLRQLLSEIISELRAVMIYQAAGKLEGIAVYEDDEKLLTEQGALFSADEFMPMLRTLNLALSDMKQTAEPRIIVETALLSLCLERNTDDNRAADVSATSTGQNDEKIRQLEAKIVQLTAIVKSLEKQGTTGQQKIERPVTGLKRQPKATASPGKKITPLVVDKDGQSLYEKLLVQVKEDKKASIAACLGGTAFAGMDETHFRLRAANSFTMNRLNQKDYKQYLESCLLGLSGREIILECIFEPEVEEKTAIAETKGESANIAVPDFSDLAPDARACMETSMKILGNHFVDKEEYDRNHHL